MENLQFGSATILDRQYFDAGKHGMVTVFTVFYDYLGVRYIICNIEGYREQLLDTVGHDFPFDFTADELDSIVIGEQRWDNVTRTRLTNGAFALYSYCYFEFLKDFCETFDTTVAVHVNQLPDSLYGTLTDEEREWHLKNKHGVTTNGYEVYLSDYYDLEDFEVPEDDNW